MKCFYHNSDLDGICSAAIVKHKYPDCNLIGINHGDPFPWELFHGASDDRAVIMVDFSLPGDEMLELNQISNLVWIDHHKTAIERLADEEFKGLQRIGEGACSLVWEFLFPDVPMPYAVKLLSEWDVWNHTDKNCKPFQYGMRLHTNSPEHPVWGFLLSGTRTAQKFFNAILDKGDTVVQYETQSNEMLMKSAAFECKFDGLKCLAVNKVMANSVTFESMWDPEKYDAMLKFGYHKGLWSVSLFSEADVDVSKVAVARGGGGHKNACGFTCAQLPPELGGAE